MKILPADSSLVNTHFVLLKSWLLLYCLKYREVLIFKMATDNDRGWINATLTFLTYENITTGFTLLNTYILLFKSGLPLSLQKIKFCYLKRPPNLNSDKLTSDKLTWTWHVTVLKIILVDSAMVNTYILLFKLWLIALKIDTFCYSKRPTT